jgi:ABC-type uncharacterized transport system permease subunit
METPFTIGVLTGAVQAGTAVMYAALGEVIVERAGVVNLGVEGTMLMGAAAGFAVTFQTGNVWLGVVAGALVAGLFNLGLALLVVTRRANQLASGLTSRLSGHRPQRADRQALRRPVDRRAGFAAGAGVGAVALGGADSVQSRPARLSGFAVGSVDLVGAWLHTLGAESARNGENSVVAYAAGLKPTRIQYQAIFLGGVMAGLGGAQLSLGYTGVWSEGMTAGRGFIAVALVIFAAWNPLRVVLGALLFGGALAFQLSFRRAAPVSPFFSRHDSLSSHARRTAFLAPWSPLRHAGGAEGCFSSISIDSVTLSEEKTTISTRPITFHEYVH